MKILFLDQSGQPGGAELCLLDVARPYRDRCLVGLFADGYFRQRLEQQQIPVQVLATQPIRVHKHSGWLDGLSSFSQLIPLIAKVTQLSGRYDLIYANTQKALIIGAIASLLSGRPLVYHLHDILSEQHFSRTNVQLAVRVANQCAALVITVSQATKAAFIAAGGRPDLVEVVHNGFNPQSYQCPFNQVEQLKQQLGLNQQFVIGHFSRLSPWKGQHILIEALQHCPQEVTALFVGEALFGEQDYAESLRQQVIERGLQERVRFLGFQTNIVPLMSVCDLIAHTSTAPEPFGRVIVEAMLCGRPVITVESGSSKELVEAGLPFYLVTPEDPLELARAIQHCRQNWQQVSQRAEQARLLASQQFHLDKINQKIAQLLQRFERHQTYAEEVL